LQGCEPHLDPSPDAGYFQKGNELRPRLRLLECVKYNLQELKLRRKSPKTNEAEEMLGFLETLSEKKYSIK
jgi:hypothetical protein